jgi:hypothetical protein
MGAMGCSPHGLSCLRKAPPNVHGLATSARVDGVVGSLSGGVTLRVDLLPCHRRSHPPDDAVANDRRQTHPGTSKSKPKKYRPKRTTKSCNFGQSQPFSPFAQFYLACIKSPFPVEILTCSLGNLAVLCGDPFSPLFECVS